MKTRLFLALLGILLFVPAGCGGNAKDEGRATLRGVVVDGNPYTNTADLDGYCATSSAGCSYKAPLPAIVAGAEVAFYQMEGVPYDSGKGVLRVQTDSAGRFAVSLPPGLYRIGTSIGSEKRNAGYCVSGGSALLSNGDDKEVILGNDLCSNFRLVID